MDKRFASFAEFYPFYLSEHANRTCRRLHFVGTSLVIGCLVAAGADRQSLVDGRRAALPATASPGSAISSSSTTGRRPFRYPLYSLCGDWVMYRDMLTGRIPF